jgi:type I restriction enzyme S subunit
MVINGWKLVALRDLIEIKHGYAFKGEYFRNELTGNVLLTPGNFAVGGGFKEDKLKFYEGPIPDEFLLRPGDMLVTMTDLSKQSDTLGYPALVPQNNGARYLHNQRLGKILLRPQVSVLKEYLYYVLRTTAYRHEIVAGATGTTVKHTSPSRIYGYKFLLPSVGEQRKIANILSSLDDKIELNRRMNETLEAMARALFKSWFVDFDPVRAKMEGRQPAGMDDETAALFPDSLEDSALGEIPSGWKADSFSEMIELTGGGTPKTSIDEYWNGRIPWFSVVDAPRDSNAFAISTEKQITEEGVANSSTKILPVGTTIISARGTVGKCALVGIPMAMNQSCYGLRGRDDRGDYFTYFATRRMVAELQQHAHGSVFSTITRNTFHGVKVAIPTPDLTRKYDEVVGPHMHLILANLHQNRTLAAIRDALLPKLLSGEIRLRGAEELVQETLWAP